MPQHGVRDHGVVVGLLSEVHQDRIVVGQGLFLLSDGVPCSYLPGMYVQVVYIEQDGRREVKHLTLFARSHPLGARDTRLPSV
jgi:hypothetical protein